MVTPRLNLLNIIFDDHSKSQHPVVSVQACRYSDSHHNGCGFAYGHLATHSRIGHWTSEFDEQFFHIPARLPHKRRVTTHNFPLTNSGSICRSFRAGDACREASHMGWAALPVMIAVAGQGYFRLPESLPASKFRMLFHILFRLSVCLLRVMPAIVLLSHFTNYTREVRKCQLHTEAHFILLTPRSPRSAALIRITCSGGAFFIDDLLNATAVMPRNRIRTHELKCFCR